MHLLTKVCSASGLFDTRDAHLQLVVWQLEPGSEEIGDLRLRPKEASAIPARPRQTKFSMARKVALLGCFLAAAFAASPVLAQFEHTTVGNLGKDFDEQIADGRLHFVKLYAPW